MEETISLREIFEVLKKRLGLIIVITVIAAATSAVVSFYVLTPIYQSSTQILVNQSNPGQNTYDVGEIRTNLELINTYSVIIKSPAILDKVKEELNLERSTKALDSQISVNSERNSQVVSISVQDPDPKLAVNLANTTAQIFKEEIPNLMNIDNVNILAAAQLEPNPSPVKPQPILNIAIALVVGGMIGVGLTFLLEYMDNTLKNEQDIERILELPVLGSITEIKREKSKKRSKGTTVTSSELGGESIGS